jgi:hypothetical protein
VYGQQLLDRALANVINFPVVYSVAAVAALVSFAIVTAAALPHRPPLVPDVRNKPANGLTGVGWLCHDG